jgi:hypothetical protein
MTAFAEDNLFSSGEIVIENMRRLGIVIFVSCRSHGDYPNPVINRQLQLPGAG